MFTDTEDDDFIAISGDDKDFRERPKDDERPSLKESLEMVERRFFRAKPSYCDTWIVGKIPDDIPLETYSTAHAEIAIRRTEDGEYEYDVIPKDYLLSKDEMMLSMETIDRIREDFRRKGVVIDRASVRDSIGKIAAKKGTELDPAVSEQIVESVMRNTVGLGIFEVLMEDRRIEDIYVDAPCDENRIYVTLNGMEGSNSQVRCRTNLICDRREVGNLINTLMRESRLQYCETHPILETNMLDDTARVTVIGYPMSPKGDSVAIRRHSERPWTLPALIANGTIDAFTAGLLSYLVDNRCTFLICGARGAGKSSLLSALMFEFPISQRILTIQDTLELPDDRMRAMGYKVQSILIDDRNEDAGTKADEALRVSLRLGESAIVLGEVRGSEARTLYQSMRTGRAGSSIMGTIHGDSAKGVYDRVVYDLGISPESFMATDVIVTMGTFRDRVTDKQSRRISELVGTSNVPGEFIPMLPERMQESPAIRRIMESSSSSFKEMMDEIEIRAGLRSVLSEMSEKDIEYLGPDWIIRVNEHMRSCMSEGMERGKIISEFRKRLKEGI